MTITQREYEYRTYYSEREYRPTRKVLLARRLIEIEARRENYERSMTLELQIERAKQ